MSYKWCVVPQCKNTSIRNPDKVFVSVPKNAKRRNKWLQLARRDPTSISSNTNVFMCEDHFDMEKDLINYMKYKMGFSKKILLTDDAMPKKFHCQEDRKRRLCDPEHSRDVFVKRRRMDLIQECEKEICLPTENSMMSTFEEDINMPQDIITPDKDEPTTTECKNTNDPLKKTIENYPAKKSIETANNRRDSFIPKQIQHGGSERNSECRGDDNSNTPEPFRIATDVEPNTVAIKFEPLDPLNIDSCTLAEDTTAINHVNDLGNKNLGADDTENYLLDVKEETDDENSHKNDIMNDINYLMSLLPQLEKLSNFRKYRVCNGINSIIRRELEEQNTQT